MAKKFHNLRKKMSPAAQARASALASTLKEQLPLHELRQARELSQEQLAAVLHIKQASVSKLERRTDMYISTLRSYIKAMGGELDIIARFPEGKVRISQFENLDEEDLHQAVG